MSKKKKDRFDPPVERKDENLADDFDELDEEDFMSDIEIRLAEERREKYEKLDQMAEEERIAYEAERGKRLRESWKELRKKIVVVRPADQDGEA